MVGLIQNFFRAIVSIITACLTIIMGFTSYMGLFVGNLDSYKYQLGINKLEYTNKAPDYEEYKNGFEYKYYDGICMVYYDDLFMRAEIISPEIEIDEGISIGSKKSYVEDFYSNEERKIKGLPENEYGFIDEHDTRVEFSFDENNLVDKITFYFSMDN